ncbi:MAG: hypothetical protein AAF206_19605 [Bacteroidota bacterium]
MRHTVILFGFLLLVLVHSRAQEDPIQAIRQRFYQTNADQSLRKQQIGGKSYFFAGDSLRKVIEKTEDQVQEYYFDQSYLEDQPYFLYRVSETATGKEEHRFYFDREGKLVRWLGPKGEDPVRGSCLESNGIALEGKNILIEWANDNFHHDNPSAQSYRTQLQPTIEKIDQAGYKADTLDFEEIVDEGNYIRFHVVLRDQNDVIRIDEQVEAEEHGGDVEKIYFDERGQKIYQQSWRERMWEEEVITHHYFRDGEHWFLVESKSMRDFLGPCQFNGSLVEHWEEEP